MDTFTKPNINTLLYNELIDTKVNLKLKTGAKVDRFLTVDANKYKLRNLQIFSQLVLENDLHNFEF